LLNIRKCVVFSARKKENLPDQALIIFDCIYVQILNLAFVPRDKFKSTTSTDAVARSLQSVDPQVKNSALITS
jgi:hypothetical protein